MALVATWMFHAEATPVPTIQVFANIACAGTPTSIVFDGTSYCGNYVLGQCTPDGHNSYFVSCSEFSPTSLDALFGNTPYLIASLYALGSSCGTMIGARVWPLGDDDCHPMPPFPGMVGVEVELNSDNSITVEFATDNLCTDMNDATEATYSSSMINNNYCVGGNTRLSVRSPATTGTTTTAGTTTTTGTTGTTGTTTTTTTTSFNPSSASTVPHVAPIAIATLATMVQGVLAF